MGKAYEMDEVMQGHFDELLGNIVANTDKAALLREVVSGDFADAEPLEHRDVSGDLIADRHRGKA